MNLNQYIEALEGLRKAVGGEVRVVNTLALAPLNAFREHDGPQIMKVRVKGPREQYEKFTSPYDKCSIPSGETVVLI